MVNSPSQQDELAVAQRKIARLEAELRAIKKLVFGPKSERREIETNPDQLDLLIALGDLREKPDEPIETETVTYQRGKTKKQRDDNCISEAGLRFDEQVPVEVIEVPCPELEGADADQYEVIDTKVTYKLAQRPAAYVVLQYEQPVVKHKTSAAMISPQMPEAVLKKSMADVSLLAGLLIDKFQYHLPLYRQHQRLQQAGINLARSTLTNLTKRSIELLMPIVQAQFNHILQSKILAIDETPIKATRGKTKSGQGKMKTGWFWPVYGEDDEIVFTYAPTRGRSHLDTLLDNRFKGTLLSDGYAVYERYAAQSEDVSLAQCWAHTRRKFIEAEEVEAALAQVAIVYIRELYQVEDEIKTKSLKGAKKQAARVERAKPIIKSFFAWCEETMVESGLTPDNKLMKALAYTLKRKAGLEMFLENPDLPIDTNHLERQIRAIPMGKKNWLFSWSELGARHIGFIQSLICTCKLQGIDPYTYLVDVLQRVGQHPNRDVEDLTPRVWKEKFAGKPLKSALQ